MEAEKCSYGEFPASKLAPEGMMVIKADTSLEFAMPKLNVQYANKAGRALNLQLPPVLDVVEQFMKKYCKG